MLTKTKIALAIALVAGSASVASAQGFDPNPANRYPHYSGARRHGAALYRHVPCRVRVAQRRVAERRAARRTAVRAGAPAAGPVRRAGRRASSAPSYGAQQDEIGVDLRDRASSPYAGGVN